MHTHIHTQSSPSQLKLDARRGHSGSRWWWRWWWRSGTLSPNPPIGVRTRQETWPNGVTKSFKDPSGGGKSRRWGGKGFLGVAVVEGQRQGERGGGEAGRVNLQKGAEGKIREEKVRILKNLSP